MQGPCPGNQVLLSQSRLLEAINGIWNGVAAAFNHRKGTSSDYGTWESLAGIMERDGEERPGRPGESSVDDEELLTYSREAILMQVWGCLVSGAGVGERA